jgi:catechol 2,3-dioxygenase-like lactoylglutathione lyase family enzyme
MQRLQAFKFELMPNGAQQRDMRRFAGSCRFVFNKTLALQQSSHESGERFIGYLAMAKQLTEWRNGPQTPWLKCAPVHPLQHALKDLERAYQNFFAKRADFPKFKRKGSSESFRYPDAKQFEIDLGLSVLDLDSTLRFFTEVLGWVESGRDDSYPRCAVSDGHVRLTLWQVDRSLDVQPFNRRRNVGLHHVALEVESEQRLNELAEVLKTRPGVIVEFPPEFLGKGPRKHMMCLEPGGIRVEFIWPGL